MAASAAGLAVLWLLVGVEPASADFTFCPQGSGAGQCNAPSAIAVDRGTGEVFIADTGNRRVDVFDASGNFERAFGWGVLDGSEEPQICTVLCQEGRPGAGAGQFSEPRAIAVDNDSVTPSPALHDVYVFDGANRNVQRFHPSGAFVLGLGSAGTGEGQFDRADNPLALGPGGVVYVAGQNSATQSRVGEFEPSGAFIKQLLLSKDECDEGKAPKSIPLNRRPFGLAVDGSGNIYFASVAGPGGVRKYNPAGTLLSSCPLVHLSSNVNALATDESNDLFVGDSTGSSEGGETAVYEYISATSPLRTLYGNGTLHSRPLSIAPYAGDLFAIEGSSPRRAVRISPEPAGPVVIPFQTKAEGVGNVRAGFKAQVNPEGKASEVHFEYVDDATYRKDIEELGPGHGFDHAKSSADQALGGAADFVPHEASFQVACPEPQVELEAKIAEGKCLAAQTRYHLRAVASNADSEPEVRPGAEVEFETLPPLQIGPVWSTGVGSESATFHAELNPTGIAATAFFEYVEEATYLKDIQSAEEEGAEDPLEHGFDHALEAPDVKDGVAALDFGAGSEALSGSASVHTLKPDTAYRYRYLAHDFFGDFASAVRALGTLAPSPAAKECPNGAFRSGAAASLPDCRAYELVSPLDKGNNDVTAPFEPTFTTLGAARARVDQATPDGGALAYAATRSFGDAVSAPLGSQYIARRDPGSGWATHALNPPLEGPSLYEGGAAYVHSLFQGFTENLCNAWLLQNTELALEPGAPASTPALYRRRNCGEEGYEALSTTGPPGFGTVAEGNDSRYTPTLQGFSVDGSVAAFKAPAVLTPEAMTVPVQVKLTCQTRNQTGVKAPSYRWLRSGAAIGAAGEEKEYLTVSADAEQPLQCQVVAENEAADKISGEHLATIRISDPASIVAPLPSTMPPIAPPAIAAPSPSTPLTVGGAGGQMLSCDPDAADWRGSPSFAYEWYRNGVKISGSETTRSLSAGELASPAAFQCVVSGTNAGGTVSEASGVTTTTPEPDPVAPEPDPRVLDIYRAYLSSGGAAELVSVLPNGFPARTHASIGTAEDHAGQRLFDSVAGAVSVDGERVFWSAEIEEPPKPVHEGSAGGVAVGEGPSRLYVRLNAGAAQSEVEEPEAGKYRCTEAAKACTIQISNGAATFLAADPGATKALYREGESLYELDVDKAAEEGNAAGAKRLIAGKVKGLLGAGAGLERTYLVSAELCSGAKTNHEGEAALAGQQNLYLYRPGESCGAGEFDFVARLGADQPFTGDSLSWATKPADRSSRVSADGMHAVFMSKAPLTGYDNIDAVSGRADSEVFLYDAAGGELGCVSCNPSGARPVGRKIGGEGGGPGENQPAWAAARIPGWENEWHASRVLSTSGDRVFFESFEGLVGRDTNGAQDVYEWERVSGEGAKGKEECLQGIGGERYVPASGGCLSLISSGKADADAEFLDASGSGSDVFFDTTASLVPQDPGLVDIYDARVEGGFPPPAASRPPCEGEACQSPPAAPERSTPASVAVEGPGNLPGGAAHHCHKGKQKVSRKGRTRCVPRHKQHRRRRAER